MADADTLSLRETAALPLVAPLIRVTRAGRRPAPLAHSPVSPPYEGLIIETGAAFLKTTS